MSVTEEIECKFLDVKPAELEAKLQKLGAKRQYRRLFKRYVFDFPDWRLDKNSSWVRVRDEGDQIRLGFKQRTGTKAGQQDQGMREIEVTVDDFEKTAELLKAIGMIQKYYEENWRTLYTLGDVEFMIDELPLIPPYIEIESDSWEKVDEASRTLGFDPTNKWVCSATQVYEHYGIDEKSYQTLTFEKQEKRT